MNDMEQLEGASWYAWVNGTLYAFSTEQARDAAIQKTGAGIAASNVDGYETIEDGDKVFG